MINNLQIILRLDSRIGSVVGSGGMDKISSGCMDSGLIYQMGGIDWQLQHRLVVVAAAVEQ